MLFQTVSEKRKRIRGDVHTAMEKGFIRGVGKLNVVPLLGLEKGEEKAGWMDIYLAGYFRSAKAPKKREPVIKMQYPFELQAHRVMVQLDEEITEEAFDRLSDPQLMACFNFAFAARLDKTEWRYNNEAAKDDGDLYKMLRLQAKMERLELYYRNVIDELMSRMAKND